jgi:hypothetical protein
LDQARFSLNTSGHEEGLFGLGQADLEERLRALE